MQAGNVQQQHFTFEPLDRIVVPQNRLMQSHRSEAAGQDQGAGK